MFILLILRGPKEISYRSCAYETLCFLPLHLHLLPTCCLLQKMHHFGLFVFCAVNRPAPRQTVVWPCVTPAAFAKRREGRRGSRNKPYEAPTARLMGEPAFVICSTEHSADRQKKMSAAEDDIIIVKKMTYTPWKGAGAILESHHALFLVTGAEPRSTRS